MTRWSPLFLVSLPVLASGCGGEDTKNPPQSTTTGTTTDGGTGGTGATATGATGGTTTATGGGGTSTGGTTTGGTGTGGTATGGTGTGGTGGQSLCGNGVIDGTESCDGDELGGQTCMSLGFPAGGTLGCLVSCNYDFAACVGSDSCSDGIDNDGDGAVDCEEPDCSAQCNDACLAPVPFNDPDFVDGSNVGHANAYASSCVAASGPEVAYALTAVTTGALDVTVFEQTTPFSVSVRSTCDDAASEIACSNIYVPGRMGVKRVIVPISAGQTVFLLVDGDGASAEGSYSIEAHSRPIECGDFIADAVEECEDGNVVSGDGCSATCSVEATEAEPNGSQGTANTFVAPFIGQILPAGDIDYVSITVPQSGTLTVSTASLGVSNCADGSIDSLVTLFDSNGIFVSQNDNSSGFCSKAVAPVLSAGTYYARIEAPPQAAPDGQTFPYVLLVSMQ